MAAKAKKPPKGANTGPKRQDNPAHKQGNPTKGGQIFGKPHVIRKVRSN